MSDYRKDTVQHLYDSGFRELVVTNVGEVEARADRITDLERRNGELEEALEHIYELGRNGAGLQCSMYAQEALTRTKEQK